MWLRITSIASSCSMFEHTATRVWSSDVSSSRYAMPSGTVWIRIWPSPLASSSILSSVTFPHSPQSLHFHSQRRHAARRRLGDDLGPAQRHDHPGQGPAQRDLCQLDALRMLRTQLNDLVRQGDADVGFVQLFGARLPWDHASAIAQSSEQ